jgi:hypothetical protein
MAQIPRSALILGLAGLIPFLWGAVTQVSDSAAMWGVDWLGPRFIGPYIGLSYGMVILCFMSGVLWGFATKAEGEASRFYALSVIPALWAFFLVGDGPVSSAIYLGAGFVGLLILDWQFQAAGLAPRWWMRLRVMLSAVVLACLSVTAFGS